MKTTIFTTFKNGENININSVFKNLDTRRKLDNAIKKHTQKVKQIYTDKKIGNYDIKYESIFS